MSKRTPHTIEDRVHVLRSRWEAYVAKGKFDHFIEFAIAVNSLAEHFNQLRMPGLVRICEGIERQTLVTLGDKASHPIGNADMLELQRHVDMLLVAVAGAVLPLSVRSTDDPASVAPDIDWIKPRAVWMITTAEKHEMTQALRLQLHFFGFEVTTMDWSDADAGIGTPLAVLFVGAQGPACESEFAFIAAIRARHPASQLFFLGVESAMEPIVALMRAGIDMTIPADEENSTVLNCILDLVQSHERENYRVLVVEDSRVAVAVIERTLAQHGIETRAVSDPGNLLEVLDAFHPDLILMDMYMPRFNGVEATRVLRQIARFGAIPIVYLSGESAVSMQVEALRLGGDQFLIKPFNPVLLAAIVKAKIERYRESQRSSRLDGLTGLLNHTAAKSRLKTLVGQVAPGGQLTVAMIDIDRFKSINDTYGHPMGDEVIRGLAWLLKGRLRSIDLIGRYGGEEFLVALPDVTPEQARAVIDRIRADFSSLPHAHRDGALHATFSAGVASYPLGVTAAALTEWADGALLQAKRNGRNRVEVAPTP